MSTDVAEANSTETEAPKSTKKRGGQRGERPWRPKPTARERVMTQSLADYVREETGKEVSPETVRAIRFCLPKWSNADSTKKLRDNMDKKLEKAKLQDKREKALAMLREAESELGKFDGDADLDDDDEDEDDDEDAENVDYDDDSDDSDDDEDIFGDDKVSADFS
ncbi:methyltransferase [Mycobacterium phage Indlulamithi]|uniref:Uncharacterized protein n=1 Tax=Mycobacterium phage Indlulamithi TaxID=2656582 RepID=A0A649VDF1_9CAUD|nr:methyltransferase [Mycobacterium phage Indlulamithi]QGJ90105.1 hypothetical protein PBI_INDLULAMITHI_67 [Mycobacterium phage Indlulamithi]